MATLRVRLNARIGRALKSFSTRPRGRRAVDTVVRRRPSWLFAFTRYSAFPPFQHREEFVPLLQLVGRLRPTRLLEIGTARGGTFYMLCQSAPDGARLVTLDLALPDRSLLDTFGRSHQTVEALEGSSRDASMRAAIAARFPDGLDVLFLDGDHSLEGVTADFDAYAPLVRPGGIVVFHDIVEDNLRRTGTDTGGRAGGVPDFWRDLRTHADDTWDTREFVRSWEQDGMGIGVAIRRGASGTPRGVRSADHPRDIR